MVKRKITVTITDDRSEKEAKFEIATNQTGNEYEMAAIIEDIADRMMNEGKYNVRTRMDDLPESDSPY